MKRAMKRLFQFFAIVLLTTPAWAMPEPEVQIKDVLVGTGDLVELGTRVKVHYTGWLMDGTQFDTSRDIDTPFEFSIGAHEVIRGWDIGVQGMRVGGKRELIIPSELGYGKQGYPDAIPPDAMLKFEIELLEINTNVVTFVDSKELAALVERGVPVIDLRRQAEWEETGIIAGSKLITAFVETSGFSPTFLKTLKETVAKTDEFVMIDKDGRRSSYLSGVLTDRKGYTHIYNAKDGIEGWIKEGYPVVKP
ncbi:MAG: FKBP-type peptidyl-prolyl cis-trans isomerase [Rhodospirillales bacterium]|nr:FKBP-type peptidyl-prolyl cis-trans isomerase [Rhodospirillales bacterium]